MDETTKVSVDKVAEHSIRHSSSDDNCPTTLICEPEHYRVASDVEAKVTKKHNLKSVETHELKAEESHNTHADRTKEREQGPGTKGPGTSSRSLLSTTNFQLPIFNFQNFQLPKLSTFQLPTMRPQNNSSSPPVNHTLA